MDLKRFAVIAVSGLLLAGCGGSSSGDGTTTGGPGGGPTGAETAGVSANATQLALGGVEFGLGSMGGSFAKPSLKPFRKAKATDLKASVAGFYKGLAAYRAKAISPLTDIPCENSGTTHFDTTPTGFTITFTDCRGSGDFSGEEEYVDGVLTFSETATGFTFTITGFTFRTTRISDGRLLEEEVIDFTVTGTFATSTLSCDGVPFPNSVTIVVDGTGSFKADDNADGTLDEDESFSATNLSNTVTVSDISGEITDPETNLTFCEPTDFTVVQSGASSFTDNLEADDSVAMTISSSDPLTIAVTSVASQSVTISGSFSVVSSCFTGSLTLTTPTPLLFTGDLDSCPIDGVIVVTGDLTGTVTFTSTGGVEIDNDGDGIADETYPDCEDAEACV